VVDQYISVSLNCDLVVSCHANRKPNTVHSTHPTVHTDKININSMLFWTQPLTTSTKPLNTPHKLV